MANRGLLLPAHGHSEAVELRELHKLVLSEYSQFQGSEKGFSDSKMGPDEPYSVCLSKIRQYCRAVQASFPKEEQTKVSKDLLQIISDIRYIHYVIIDAALYGGPPKNENDVHIRIEGILKCLFADLKHKPVLTKSIKNFEPDTGVPSISTLIEYKFLDRKEDVAVIANQVLADTRGYVSKDWNQFLYVIYETNRFKPEKEWAHLLTQAGVPENTKVIVLSGESPPKKRNAKPRAVRHGKQG